ncbi:hypothetical protein [Peribacillus frigoritolerans]|uniref:hypothetical protein n=1 Tax=Peribacillus frigoritolerans TaxID=450367 RepID=UPI002ED0F38A|nr:hypothetical protein V2I71_02275 [Peribacillus frigoritolerans]
MSLILGTEQFHEGINLVIPDDLGDELDLCMGVIAMVVRLLSGVMNYPPKRTILKNILTEQPVSAYNNI